jgi:hypothetical protein
MAVVLFSGLISGIQGKLNGSVLSKGRSGAVIYDKPSQRLKPTKNQLGIRTSFAVATNQWETITPAQKADWDTIASNNPVSNRFGESVILSGFNVFKKMMALRYPTLPAPVLIPNLANQAPYQLALSLPELAISIQDAGYRIDEVSYLVTVNSSSAAVNQAILYISLPVSDPSKPYFKTWYRVSSAQLIGGVPVSTEIPVSGVTALMPKGFRSFPNAWHLLKIISIIPNQGKVSTDFIIPVQATFPIVIDFPTLSASLGPGEESGVFNIGSTRILNASWIVSPISPNFNSEFELLSSWGAPKVSAGDLTLVSYGAELTLSTLIADAGFFLVPQGTGAGNTVYPEYVSTGFSFSSADGGKYLPCRARIKHIATNTLSNFFYQEYLIQNF